MYMDVLHVGTKAIAGGILQMARRTSRIENLFQYLEHFSPSFSLRLTSKSIDDAPNLAAYHTGKVGTGMSSLAHPHATKAHSSQVIKAISHRQEISPSQSINLIATSHSWRLSKSSSAAAAAPAQPSPSGSSAPTTSPSSSASPSSVPQALKSTSANKASR